MKKILTLLVMFLTMWSFLGAQTPVFGYQAVVLTSDNELVENTPVDVTISVLNGGVVKYSEMHGGLLTDGLGMLNLLVGNGTVITGSVEDVNWADAEIRNEIVINGGETVVVETEIAAAPYALQAMKTSLTTERIVQYVKNPETTVADYAQCMTALGNNVPENGLMWQKTRNRIINYIKNHREIARDVFIAYLEAGTAEDVEWFYNKVSGTGALDEAIDVMAEVALENRDFAKDVFFAYLQDMQPSEANEFIDAILTHDDEILPYVLEYFTTHRMRVLSLINAYFQSASATEVQQALGVFNTSPMKQKFVDEKFYDHLDNYIHPVNSFTDEQIRARVNSKLGDDYVKKTQCGGDDVDICNMRDGVNTLMGH